jgi:U3 small nucleolar RNA-associated protein 25
MLQQNWSHVLFALTHLNRQPQSPHSGTDYSRIRITQYLESNAAHFRQTLVFSAFLTPELNALYTTHMRNIASKFKASPIYPGAIESLPLAVRGAIKQSFTRLKSSSTTDASTDPDDRFKYFTSAVLPSLTKHHKQTSGSDGGSGILLFIPTYHDFVRVRNFFASDPRCAHFAFGSISEYSDMNEVRRSRSHFYTGKHDVLLVSGRAHHFRRYMNMRGTRRVVFYGVPENKEWYGEVVGWLEGEVEKAGEASVRVVFSRWEVLALERVVGTKRVGRMVREGREDVFDFR